MSHSLRPHGLQHARLPCPSPAPRACSNSCPSSQWCHPTISSSVVPFFSCLQSFPASRSFPVSQFFTSGGQSIRVLASTSFLPMNIQDWFSLWYNDWISLSPRDSQECSLIPRFKNINSSMLSLFLLQNHQFFGPQLSLRFNSHPYMTTGKTIALARLTLVGKVVSAF